MPIFLAGQAALLPMKMRHFDIEQWTDFVRGVGAPAALSAMRKHLDDGCDACAAVVHRLGALVAVAKEDMASAPPEHLVRFARAAFVLHRPEKSLALPDLVCRLVFNSRSSSLVAGTRGPAEAVSRQTLYEAGEFSVHLRFEQLVGGPLVSLVGQVANRRTPDPPMAHVPVLLTRGRRVVARSLANEFGEFQVEYEPVKGLELQILLAARHGRIRLSLSDVHRDD